MQSSAAPHIKRLDIQGLRAVAVLAVVANHLTAQPRGGFVGVDIFFVISGFVITLGLTREYGETGSLSFKTFYYKRVARIVPASLMVVIVTVIASCFIFFRERAVGVLWDGIWASLFVGNWRFASEGTDYWGETSVTSPLQHYWSLGVEEQFYFVWPMVVLLVLSAASRAGLGRNARRLTLVVALALLIAGSFTWALSETVTNASWAYFSTLSRAWELGVGALLAVASPYFFSIGRRWRLWVGWLGGAGIFASFVLISKSVAFPAPWALLPVISVSLIIIAGTGKRVPDFKFLTNRFSVYIGNASYSLYLWHFPVIILVGALWPNEGGLFYVAALGLMTFLAITSYEFIELPAQRRLLGWRSNGYKFSRRRSGATGRGARYRYLALGALATATTILVPAAINQFSQPTTAYASFESAATGQNQQESHQSKLSGEINDALAAEEWPELSPSLETVLSEGRPEEVGSRCGDTDLAIPNCIFGEGKPKTAVVLGDSTGITLLPTVRTALGETHNIRGMTKAGCVVLDIAFEKKDPAEAEDCESFKTDAIAAINELRPDMVIVSNTAGTLGNLASGTPISQAGAEVQEGTAKLLQSISPSGAELVIVSAPPSGKPPTECATQASKPRECVYQIPESFYVAGNAMRDAARAHGAIFIDTRSWFCNDAGYCPAFVGNVLVKRDAVHTTRQYAPSLAPLFIDELTTGNQPELALPR